MFSAAVKRMHFMQKIEAARPEQIFLVRGKDMSGKRAWYYILVDKNMREIFRKKGGVPFLKLSEYGEILYSGFGEHPPLSIVKLMREEYGFNG